MRVIIFLQINSSGLNEKFVLKYGYLRYIAAFFTVITLRAAF